MTKVRIVFSTLLCVLFALSVHDSVFAQAALKYRDYALESSLASVVKTIGVSEREVRTLHERPARIQEIEWRLPYSSRGPDGADPVRYIQFSFYDDQLYRMIVTYHRDRTQGLTNDDIVQSLTATYGVPRNTPVRKASAAVTPNAPGYGTVVGAVVAQWDEPSSVLTLMRDQYSQEVQLSLVSKPLDERARRAVTEASRLDTLEAPERERARRAKEIADALATGEKAREANKPVFRP
jgi:hypothetical protein